MFLFLARFNRNKKAAAPSKKTKNIAQKSNEQIAKRKGELGEFKIDIQLDQLPKNYRYLSDLMVENSKSKSGYSQIDHVVITPYGIFVIETKNYQGTIYGGKNRRTWSVNGKFSMQNPFDQNFSHIQSLKQLINDKYHNLFVSMVSFTKRCRFKLEVDYRKISSDNLIVYDIELSEYIHRKITAIRRLKNEPLLQDQEITEIHQAFSKANITDSSVRKKHVEAIKANTSKGTSKQAICTTCQEPVSKKVEQFCLSNKKFNGKIYCFEHQKLVK